LLSYFFLVVDKYANIIEDFFLMLTFLIFFFTLLQIFYDFFYVYYDERKSTIRANYLKLFARQKEALALVTAAYQSYEQLPLLALNYTAIAYLKQEEQYTLNNTLTDIIDEAAVRAVLKELQNKVKHS